jgi:hypothetical protein
MSDPRKLDAFIAFARAEGFHAPDAAAQRRPS